ncbi:MAG: BREX-2 system adenine-specific DNA-methyltransferase PglX [Candidatus Xenobia bacterium]
MVRAHLTDAWERERAAGHTVSTYETWRDEYLTQVAVAWILSCVFVRYMEDNDLLDGVYLAGEKERLALARDAHTLYFQSAPTHSDRDYLEHLFRTCAAIPDLRDLFGTDHNPLWLVPISGDAAERLIHFWQQVDPTTGALLRSFVTDSGDTRFLGDLYQDLSEAARKKYALLQTPEFVEAFILDRTLEPAIETFGLEAVRLIDPTCGSGHFLLGAFSRLLGHWQRQAPGLPAQTHVERALRGVTGVDLNPFAVAIARFRLLVAALHACKVTRLKDAPDFSVLPGRPFHRALL